MSSPKKLGSIYKPFFVSEVLNENKILEEMFMTIVSKDMVARGFTYDTGE